MKIEVRLYAQMVDYLPPSSKGNEVELVLTEGATLRDLLTQLKIPESLTGSLICLVNGEHEKSIRTLTEGDVVCILPPIVGGKTGFERTL